MRSRGSSNCGVSVSGSERLSGSAGTAVAEVWLHGWEQLCCGPLRRVGDVAVMQIAYRNDRLTEQRHEYGDGTLSQAVTATITGISWLPGEVGWTSGVFRYISGFGEPVTITSTEEVPKTDDTSWVLIFTIDTDDPLPGAN